MVTHNYLLLLTTTNSIYESSAIHWTCRVYFTLLGVNSSGVSALGHKPCSVNLSFYYYYYYYHYHYPYHYHYHYHYRYRYRYRYRYYYYYFTHLDTQKTPKTSDSLKPTENKKEVTKARNSDRSVLSSLLGQDWVRRTNDDLTRLTREGKEIVETTCENSYIHFNLQFVAKAALICESVRSLN